ncbi:hypothetical protein HD554DRAFT_1159693 [Boletus coccyginus]|nr:hypothetical protein HD554DRAFT_1159693 [Boletus coccyginus]
MTRAPGMRQSVVKDSHGNVIGTSSGWPITLLRQTWTADERVLSTHEPPTWWNQAKYGIFVHWDVFSVPTFVGLLELCRVIRQSHLEILSRKFRTRRSLRRLYRKLHRKALERKRLARFVRRSRCKVLCLCYETSRWIQLVRYKEHDASKQFSPRPLPGLS